MSYNGIGLSSAKGSSTNGFVQKNYTRNTISNYERRKKNKSSNERVKDYINEQIQDKELVKHEDKRKIELQISEYRDKLEDDGLDEDEIELKCQEFKEKLLKPARLQNSYRKRETRIRDDRKKESNEKDGKFQKKDDVDY